MADFFYLMFAECLGVSVFVNNQTTQNAYKNVWDIGDRPVFVPKNDHYF